MATDEFLPRVNLSPDPAMYRPKPSSEKTQDISHLLTSLFKNVYTGEVIGKDTGANLIRSKGGDNPYHQKFVEDLQQIRTEYESRMSECDKVERHIIQARARATAQEERMLSCLKNEAGDALQNLGLPPVESYFRWCVDNDLLKKHKLVCPEDYITDTQPITRAPRGLSGPSLYKETFSFHQHISKSPVDDGYCDPSPPDISPKGLGEKSLSNLTLSSLSSSENISQSKTRKEKCDTSKKSTLSKRRSYKMEMTAEEREDERARLAQLEKRHNFLKNPRFLPPSSQHGGRSLILPTKKKEMLISGKTRVIEEHDANEPVPVFLANPPVVFFPEYEVGQIYEMTVELRNMTASSRHVRVIPPSSPYFSIGLGKFPGEGGIVAPGMSCHYTIRFVPDSLADFEDFILVETQAPYPVLVPIEARRPPPILTLPRTLDCGPCLVGGVKLIECLCRNEGFSRGRFCIMPKNIWPPANFRTVANAGFVEQLPFCIRPAVFELYPGQETIIEVVFFPSSSETYSQVFTIVCDNCQVKDITLTGYGQVLGLQLVSVSEDKSIPVSTEHLVQFQSTNVHSTEEKSIAVRNTTHLELPFYWQIVKPCPEDLQPEEPSEMTKMEYSVDEYTAFTISPSQGILQPHKDHVFTMTYTPTELTDYHSIAQMILRDVPDPPSTELHPSSFTQLDPLIQDVIVIDLEFKGTTEPFNLLLEPYAVIFPGESFIGTAVRKQFKMWNNSKSTVQFEWENTLTPNIIQIEPHSGNIESSDFCEYELIFTGLRTGFTSQNVNCHILHSAEPVVLHVEATFKGPVVAILMPSLDLGLIKLGNKTLSKCTIENLSPLAAKWKIHESRDCIAVRGEEESSFSLSPGSGVLPPLGTAEVSVLFKPLACQRLETVLELEVENGEGSYLPVIADVQMPQVCLLSSSLVFSEVYVGVPAQSTIKMFNQGQLPAKFSWQEFTANHPDACSVSVTPVSGLLGPNEESEMCVTLETYTLDEIDDLTLCCLVEDMKEPLVLNVKAKPKGLHVSYSLSASEELNESTSSNAQELLLDFGSEVTLQNTVKRTFTITNHSGISAPFSLWVSYFSGCLTPQPKRSSNSTSSLIQRTARFAKEVAKRAEDDFRTSLLSDGKGAAFIPHPSTGVLGPFQQISIDVTAYNNMWGEYSDLLVCTVGNLSPKEIPIKMNVKGCPLYFQMTGPRPDRQTEGPVIRFGTHVSGGDTVSRCLRINNPSPCDIRIDWETYNREQDTSKLLDLVLLFGDPFPLKDIDGNEIVDSSLDFPDSDNSPVNWDKIPISSGTTSSSSFRSIGKLEGAEQTEHTDEGVGDNLNGLESENETPEEKLISVILRSHEGVASDYPYCITPRQTIVPARGSSTIHVSFTPLMLSEITIKTECSGFALGFLSLDDMSARHIPGKVKRLHAYGVEPIRMELQAFVKPALLSVDFEDEDEEGLVFYSVASDLIPDKKSSNILTEFMTTRNLKLINCTETPLYFRLLLTKPFAVAAVDPNKSIKTSHSDREERAAQMVLHPQQNTLVKVSFCTTLELLTYQNLPDDQMLPGVKILQSENGEKKLHFTQKLLIEYSNNSSQQVPLSAYLTVPVLQLSGHTVDFGTCFVGQTRTQEVFLLNRSGSKSYWMALLDKRNRYNDQDIFSVSPTSGILDAHVSHTSSSKEMLSVTFTARTNKDYETVVMVHGMLGEKPLKLLIKGRGSYDEKYEALLKA